MSLCRQAEHGNDDRETNRRAGPPYESLTRPQMRALLDRRARRQFRMSIDEFEAALDRGEFADEPQATALAILLRGA